MDLEHIPTDDLIDAVVNRPDFLGVVLRFQGEGYRAMFSIRLRRGEALELLTEGFDAARDNLPQ